MQMKVRVLAVLFSTLFLLIAPVAFCEGDQAEYRIEIRDDGSATWIVVQTGMNINASLSTLEELQNKVALLVETARNETNRNMTADIDSVKSAFSGLNVIVEYKFFWENFAKIENDKIMISDVFQVKDFFLRLYGDGEIYLTYPSQYVVETASPLPYERDDSIRMLKWLKTADFTERLPIIVLKKETVSKDFLWLIQQNSVVIASLILVTIGVFTSFYALKHRKRNVNNTAETPLFADDLHIESDEEIIIKLLKSSGGKMYQSRVAGQCKFSKAKTSQLLSALENRGAVSRLKKGRDKIVFLVKENKK